jgi:hypothetical protein
MVRFTQGVNNVGYSSEHRLDIVVFLLLFKFFMLDP